MKNERLRTVSGIGKDVTTRDKYTGERMLLGQIVDEIAVLQDDENKYVIQLIRLFHPIDDQEELFRVGYYTARRDERLCFGAQFAPILRRDELSGLIEQARRKGWLEVKS